MWCGSFLADIYRQFGHSRNSQPVGSAGSVRSERPARLIADWGLIETTGSFATADKFHTFQGFKSSQFE